MNASNGPPARRPPGALEDAVLTVLWSGDQAMTPAEVRQALDQPLAYTTVMSTLSRLYRKGLVTRTTRGRGYAYAAAVREDDHTALAMAELLRRRHDRAAVLSRFVSSLSAEDEALLQRLLRGDDVSGD